MKILILSASTSGTKTKKVTATFTKIMRENYGTDNDISYIDLQDKSMVFSDGRNYLDYTGDTAEVLSEIMQSDVIVFGTPIYQASIPASLKNIFDLLPMSAFDRKVIGLIVTGGSPRHFLVAETQIKPIIHYMHGTIVPKYVYIVDTDFSPDGSVNDEIEFRLQTLLEDTIFVANTYTEIWSKQDDMFGCVIDLS